MNGGETWRKDRGDIQRELERIGEIEVRQRGTMRDRQRELERAGKSG